MYHPVNDASPATHNILQVTAERMGNNKTWNFFTRIPTSNKHLLY